MKYLVIIKHDYFPDIFGVYNKGGAIEKAKYLKQMAPGKLEKTPFEFVEDNFCLDELTKENSGKMEKAYNLGVSLPFDTAQVCILGNTEFNSKFKCVCKELLLND